MSDTDPYMAPDAPNAEEYRYVETPVADSFDQKVDEKPVEAPVVEEQAVPEGSIKEVLAWVGDDTTKAQTALKAEKSGEKRTTLISKLEAVIN
jgi:hypothetical protein